MAEYVSLDPPAPAEVHVTAGALARGARKILPLIALPPERDELRGLIEGAEDALERTR